MIPFTLTPQDIRKILISLALSRARGSFLPGGAEAIGVMPVEHRQAIAGAALAFFRLESSFGNELAAFSDWEKWAEFLYERLSACPSSPGYAFSTSGSTGQPKLCLLAQGDLMEETGSLLPFFTDRRRVISVMPIHHVFGFAFALLLPKYLGIPVLHLPPLPTAEFFRTLQNGDLILAFPVFWQSLLKIRACLPAAACPDALQGVSSAAPCPPELIERLLGNSARSGPGHAFLAGMTEIYGSTEFGAVGLRRRCRGPYDLLAHLTREALPNGEWGLRRGAGEAAPLPDILDWSDERRFFPRQRKDSAVQVGGYNVFPLRVARVLGAHPKVRECSVRLMRPDEGHRLKAFVVPEEAFRHCSQEELSRELKHWLARRFEPAATPKAIRLGEALPLTPSGKLADWNAFED
jgi:4-coumarate--CoA ligase (photoactive yellow protein activation family)